MSLHTDRNSLPPPRLRDRLLARFRDRNRVFLMQKIDPAVEKAILMASPSRRRNRFLRYKLTKRKMVGMLCSPLSFIRKKPFTFALEIDPAGAGVKVNYLRPRACGIDF